MRLTPAALSTLLLAACSTGAPDPLCQALEETATAATSAVESRRADFQASILDAAALTGRLAPEACQVSSPRFKPEQVLEPSGIAGYLPPSLAELANASAEIALFRDTCGRGDTASQQRVVDTYREAIAGLPARHDLVVLQQQRTDPTMESPTRFISGELTSVGLVYSHAEQRFVCRSDVVSVDNREEVAATRSGRDIDFLQRDLNRRSIEAVRAELRALATP